MITRVLIAVTAACVLACVAFSLSLQLGQEVNESRMWAREVVPRIETGLWDTMWHGKKSVQVEKTVDIFYHKAVIRVAQDGRVTELIHASHVPGFRDWRIERVEKR